MSAPISSRIVDVSQMDKASIHLKWAGNVVGEFQVLVQNNDKDTWVILSSGAPWSIIRGDNESQIVLNELPFTKLQLQFIPTTATVVTLSAYLTSKSVGA
jgi:hypothetical protein